MSRWLITRSFATGGPIRMWTARVRCQRENLGRLKFAIRRSAASGRSGYTPRKLWRLGHHVVKLLCHAAPSQHTDGVVLIRARRALERVRCCRKAGRPPRPGGVGRFPRPNHLLFSGAQIRPFWIRGEYLGRLYSRSNENAPSGDSGTLGPGAPGSRERSCIAPSGGIRVS